jgi:hypothetical protein
VGICGHAAQSDARFQKEVPSIRGVHAPVSAPRRDREILVNCCTQFQMNGRSNVRLLSRESFTRFCQVRLARSNTKHIIGMVHYVKANRGSVPPNTKVFAHSNEQESAIPYSGTDMHKDADIGCDF